MGRPDKASEAEITERKRRIAGVRRRRAEALRRQADAIEGPLA